MFDSKVLQVQVSPILYSLVAWLTSHSPFPYINHYIPYMNWNFCIQIPRGRVDFNRDSAGKSPCWFWVLSLQLFNPDLLPFTPIVSYLIWPFYGSTLLGPFKWPVLCRTALQQLPLSSTQHRSDFPRAYVSWKSFPFICLNYNGAQLCFFASSIWSFQVGPIQVLFRPNFI